MTFKEFLANCEFKINGHLHSPYDILFCCPVAHGAPQSFCRCREQYKKYQDWSTSERLSRRQPVLKPPQVPKTKKPTDDLVG